MIRYAKAAVEEIGPEDAGMHMTADEFERARGREGHRYELIEGVLHVSPGPDPLHADLQDAIHEIIKSHRDSRGVKAFRKVWSSSRVMVRQDQDALTNPEPDVAAYTSFPSPRPRTFAGVAPALVVEIVSPGGHNKDYGRNPELYERVPEIMEYWVVDPTRGGERPAMTVFVRPRPGEEFERTDIEPGGVYESKHWPGLRVDLSRLLDD